MTDLKEKRQRPPTEKQVKFASAIAERLCIQLPRIRTRQSLFLFIRDNKAEYDAMRTECLGQDYDQDYDCYMAEAMGIDLMTGCLGD